MNEGSRYSLGDLIKYFIKLGFIGFGGSIAPVGAMHRDLVENERWISEEEYKEGLALSQLAPGPLASQLAIYIGYVNYKVIGAALAGLAFVLPSFVIVVFIGWAYVHYNGLPWIHAVFYGVGSAVIGIIAVSSYKLAVKNISKDWLMVIIFSVSSFFTFYLEEENILIIICSGLIFMFLRSPPKFDKKRLFFFAHLGSGFGSITVNSKLLKLGCFFCKSGHISFWKCFSSCALLVRWNCKRKSLVNRAAIFRRCCSGYDNARTRCYYRWVYWLSNTGLKWRLSCCIGNIPSLLFIYNFTAALF